MVFESWGCHPDYSGHVQKFEAMRTAYEKANAAKKPGARSIFGVVSKLVIGAIGERANCRHQSMKHIPARRPTLLTLGNIEYYICKNCGDYFSDKDGLHPISKVSVIVRFGEKPHKNESAEEVLPEIVEDENKGGGKPAHTTVLEILESGKNSDRLIKLPINSINTLIKGFFTASNVFPADSAYEDTQISEIVEEELPFVPEDETVLSEIVETAA